MLSKVSNLILITLLVSCSTTHNNVSPPNSEKYLKLMNKKLSERARDNLVRKPKVYSSMSSNGIVSTTRACTANNNVDDGGTINFYFKRYCNMYLGNFIKGKCLDKKDELIFSTIVDFSRSCTVSGGSSELYWRTLTITKYQ